MPVRNEYLTPAQRDGLWKWRWLGFRESTPAFKASLVILGLLAIAIFALSLVRF
jgi:hypothetical protein